MGSLKNTLEGTNSRITEAEEWIGELEDRMMEITAEEKNKGKGMKRIEEASETFGAMLNTPVFEL